MPTTARHHSTTRLLIPLFLAATRTTAHFQLQYPPTLGFDHSTQETAPCGGPGPDSNSPATELPVSAFPLQLSTTHPQSDFLLRFTEATEPPFDWQDVVAVAQQGLGAFCLPGVSVGEEWVGREGVLQVVQKGVDGVLYQCSSVQFVSGMNETVGSGCSNGTGTSASISDMGSEGFFEGVKTEDGGEGGGDEGSDVNSGDGGESGDASEEGSEGAASTMGQRVLEKAIALGAVAAFLL